MKKILTCIAIAALTLSLCTACSDKDDSKKDSVNNNNSSHTDSTFTDGTSTESTAPVTDAPQAEAKIFTDVSNFNNGLAFVKYQNDNNVYCIDKTGDQLFQLENCRVATWMGFNSKVALVETTTLNEYILCDKQGKVYQPADFGATRFVCDKEIYEQAFLDGYILLEKREESYTGTTIEMSVMDADFNTLVPFSTELTEAIDNVHAADYYDGYLYFFGSYVTEARILDLRTGTQLSDTTEMQVSKPLLDYWAEGSYGLNFENVEWGDIYNALTGEVVGKVADSETISTVDFINDVGLVRYSTDNGIWFTIIGQDGTKKFEPIQAGSRQIAFDGETIITYEITHSQQNGTVVKELSIQSYDLQGNLLADVVLESSNWGLGVTIHDGVIKILNGENLGTVLYNPSLEKLF